jgi:hypothetical protein
MALAFRRTITVYAKRPALRYHIFAASPHSHAFEHSINLCVAFELGRPTEARFYRVNVNIPSTFAAQTSNNLKTAVRMLRLIAASLLAMLLFGCSSKSGRVTIPAWDPGGFASVILERLDDNGDSLIDASELQLAPGLANGAKFIDNNSDRKLSREELEARFTMYRDMRLGLTSKAFRVTYNGRPLVGAEVRFVPEFFLTDVIEPASGTTIIQGMVNPSIEGQSTPLMRVGYYRVEVTSPGTRLPASFNSATTVGVEVSPFVGEPADLGTIEIQLRDTK